MLHGRRNLFVRGLATKPVACLPNPRPVTWAVMQLVDSALPTGGFAHSSGLEAAWQQGRIAGPDELLRFVQAAAGQAARSSIPFVDAGAAAACVAARTTANDVVTAWAVVDARQHLLLASNATASRASISQGAAMLRVAAPWLAEGSSGLPQTSREPHQSCEILEQMQKGTRYRRERRYSDGFHCHYAPVGSLPPPTWLGTQIHLEVIRI